MKDFRILITGGPGAGASATGRLLAKSLDVSHIESDDFFHKPTDPPFQEQYAKEERNRLILDAFDRAGSWVLSGSLCAWDIGSVPMTHAVLLNVGAAVREERLRQREAERFGERIAPGGDMHAEHVSFLAWAAGYETAALDEGRCLARERAFIETNAARSLEIESVLPLPDLVSKIRRFIGLP